MNNPLYSKLKFYWDSIPLPDQVKRLIVIFSIFIVGLVIARHYLLPTTFGEKGHYRAAAVDSVLTLPTHYAGQEVCAECHDEQALAKNNSNHQKVSCEICHGPGEKHVNEPTENHLLMPSQRDLCQNCHAYDASRPTGFPQIIPTTHNPMEPCMSCHNPHNPETPHTPEECSACHGNIARTKAVSHHAKLECTQCHKTPDNHKIDPRTYRASKPNDRTFCGGCHGKDAKSSKEIPRIDIQSHYTAHLCWQCHYPHYPEVNQ